MIECCRRGLFLQGILHDLSKYSPAELLPSARYFQGDKSPVDAAKYSVAWLNHKAKNKHHWEYWTDFEKGAVIAVPMPSKYVEEMFCDLIGASKAYNSTAFKRGEPLEYFLSHSGEWVMENGSKEYLKYLLEQYAGL
jgi:hypothetical protein